MLLGHGLSVPPHPSRGPEAPVSWFLSGYRPEHHAQGRSINAAKLLGGRAGHHACEQAVITHGGFGYASEFHVERYLREVWITRLAPVSEQLVLCHIAEKALGLPKSY